MFTRLATAALMLTGLASAATYTFNFTSASDNSNLSQPYVVNDTTGTIKASITAWGTGSGTTLAAARLGTYNGAGLGVCDAIEIGGGTNPTCSDPHHKVDNLNSYNFVLFSFFRVSDNSAIAVAAPVLLDLNSFGTGDTDLSYWWGSNVPGTINFNPTTQANRVDVSNFGGSLANLGATGTGGKLLIGANSSGTDRDDAFKIGALTVDWTAPNNDPSVPEPATYAMMGAALLTLGMLRRRA